MERDPEALKKLLLSAHVAELPPNASSNQGAKTEQKAKTNEIELFKKESVISMGGAFSKKGINRTSSQSKDIP